MIGLRSIFKFCALGFALIFAVVAQGREVSPIWNSPIYVDMPYGWFLMRKNSPDSMVFLLKKGRGRIVFDYGVLSPGKF